MRPIDRPQCVQRLSNQAGGTDCSATGDTCVGGVCTVAVVETLGTADSSFNGSTRWRTTHLQVDTSRRLTQIEGYILGHGQLRDRDLARV